MKESERSLIVLGGGGHARVLIDELRSAGRSVLGITDADTTVIHAEPQLRYPIGYTGIDTSLMHIFSDTLVVFGSYYI